VNDCFFRKNGRAQNLTGRLLWVGCSRSQLAATEAKQTEARNFFLEMENKDLAAQNRSLREQLKEVTGDIVRVLKHLGKAALGPFLADL
jgi:hypothetical protein